MRRLPGLGALRTFEAAARHRSFTRAADELAVTPAAVSSQVRALEQQIGTPLFRRTSRLVEPTQAGEVLAAAVGEALDVVARAVDRIRPTGGRETLSVTTGLVFAVRWLVPRLGAFRRAEGEPDVRLDVTERLVDLEREGVDVAIRFGAGAYPGLRVDRLFAETVFPVCSPRLLAGDHPLREPSDLRHHTLIHETWPHSDGSWPDWRAWLLAAGVEGVDPTRGLHFSQMTLAVEAAVDGQGVALGSTNLMAADLASGRLVRPFALGLESPAPFAYYLVTRPPPPERPLVEAFRAWILGACAEDAPTFKPRLTIEQGEPVGQQGGIRG